MSLVPVPTWLCLIGSWDKAQVCWKHLPYSSGGAKVAFQPHKLGTWFESNGCIQTIDSEVKSKKNYFDV